MSVFADYKGPNRPDITSSSSTSMHRPSSIPQNFVAASLLSQADADLDEDLASSVVNLQNVTRAYRSLTEDPVAFFGAAKIDPHLFEADDVRRINQMTGRTCFTHTISFHDLFGLEMNRLLKDLSDDLDPETGKAIAAEWKCLWMRGYLGLFRLSEKEIFPEKSALTSEQFLFPDVYAEQLKNFTLNLRSTLVAQHQKKKEVALTKKNGAQKAQALDEHFKERTHSLFSEFNAMQKMLAKKFLIHPQKVLLLLDTPLNRFPGALAMQPMSQVQAFEALTQLDAYTDLIHSAGAAAHQKGFVPASAYLEMILQQVNSLKTTHDIMESARLCRVAMKSLKKNLQPANELITPPLKQMLQYQQMERMRRETPQALFLRLASFPEIEKTTSDFIFHSLTMGWANDCTHSLISILEQLDDNPPVYNYTKRFVLNLKAIAQAESLLPQLKIAQLKPFISTLYAQYQHFMNGGVGGELSQILKYAHNGTFNLSDTYMDHREDLLQKLNQFIEQASLLFSILANQQKDLCEQEDLLIATQWFARLCILRYDLAHMANPFDPPSENGDLFPAGYIELLLLDPSFEAPLQPEEEDGDLPPAPAAAAAPAKKKKKKKTKELADVAAAASLSIPPIPTSPATAAPSDLALKPSTSGASAADQPDDSTSPPPAAVSVAAPAAPNDASLPVASRSRAFPQPRVRRAPPEPASHSAAAPDAVVSSFDIEPPQSRKHQDVTKWVTKVLGLAPLSRKRRGKGDHKIYSDRKGITLSVPDHSELATGTLHAIRRQYIEQRQDIANRTAAAAAPIIAPNANKKKKK